MNILFLKRLMQTKFISKILMDFLTASDCIEKLFFFSFCCQGEINFEEYDIFH